MPAGAESTAPIERRGWCVFEKAMSSITKSSACCLKLSLAPKRKGGWFDFYRACQATRSAPLTPNAFEMMMRDGIAAEKNKPGRHVTTSPTSNHHLS